MSTPMNPDQFRAGLAGALKVEVDQIPSDLDGLAALVFPRLADSAQSGTTLVDNLVTNLDDMRRDAAACWDLLEEDNPEARHWQSLSGALQHTLVALRGRLDRANARLARARAKAHQHLDELIDGDDDAPGGEE